MRVDLVAEIREPLQIEDRRQRLQALARETSPSPRTDGLKASKASLRKALNTTPGPYTAGSPHTCSY